MPALWIAVEEGIGDSAKVWRFAQRLLTPPESPRSPTLRDVATAIGLLVQLWLKVADKRETGRIDDVPNALLASWAKWDGDPDVFGQLFRETFLTDGQIHDWEKHQGKLIAYRAKERARWHLRTNPATPGETPREPPVEAPGPDSKSDSNRKTPLSIRSEDDLVAAVGGAHRPTIAHFLDRAPPASGDRTTWVFRLAGYLQGLDFPPGQSPIAEDILTACRDYTGNFSAIHFRGFVLRVMRARLNPKPQTIGRNGHARTTREAVDRFARGETP
jgi:hypothetical protein